MIEYKHMRKILKEINNLPDATITEALKTTTINGAINKREVLKILLNHIEENEE